MKHEFARRLRRDQTEVERKLWYALRNRRLAYCKFRRQQPIGPYIVDFVSFEKKLVIELDGIQHGLDRNALSDGRRTSRLESQGFHVMRFWNVELIENFDGVVERIWQHVTLLPDPSPGAHTRASLSHGGRGK